MKAFISIVLTLIAASTTSAQVERAPEPTAMMRMTEGLTAPSGILYDRVVGLSSIDRYDGSADAPALDWRRWRQMYYEIRRASQSPLPWPSTKELESKVEPGVIPLVLMDVHYDRLRAGAIEDGSLEIRGGLPVATGQGSPFRSAHVFAAATVRDYTHRGQRVLFSLDDASCFTNGARPQRIEIDFDDGLGYRSVRFGRPTVVSYATTGLKTLRLRASTGSEVLHSSFLFRVASLAVPTPDDTLHITATVPYDGLFASGDAYLYLAAGHTVPTRPVVLIEGFDLDNSMNWDELYTLVNQENLIEDLRALGYDAIILNFAEATEYIQRNAFVVTELIQQVQSYLPPTVTMVAVGASMGGLVTRYALAWMETNAIDHRVRTFIAFDSPQYGANIPLGMQYWLHFFEGESTDAAFLLSRLNTPAARQMLVYHYTDPPTSPPVPDPLMADLYADMALVGGYPSQPRLVSIINGSSAQADQGFAPGARLITWESSGLIGVTGNISAVPDGNLQQIFDGEIRFLGIPVSQLQVSVSGTLPYDGAPGGSRASMAQMDSTEAPYGDIIANHDSHCFIPSISALGLNNTTDPFYDIVGDTMIVAHSDFDAVYYPTAAANQGHVTVTVENKDWIVWEITKNATGVPLPGPYAGAALYQNAPNPFNPTTTIRFTLPAAAGVRLAVYDVAGRRVVTLIDEQLTAGDKWVEWDGKDTAGRPVGSGVYLYRLEAGGATMAKKMVLLK